MKISERAHKITSSATLVTTSKAKQMVRQGIEIVDLSVGEPDFNTPSHIRESAKRALDEGYTKYTPPGGIPTLKKAISTKLKRDNNLDYSPEQIVVTCGAKHAIYNALQVLVDEGEEVIFASPYWVSYPTHTALSGGTSRIIHTSIETGFKLTPEQIQLALSNRTAAIILNTPSNPTGSAYTRDELIKIARSLEDTNVAIISDEIYEKITYDDFHHTSIVEAYPPIKKQTIIVNGLSKSHAMTGWRIGFAAGPSKIISKMQALQVQQISGITSFVQKAAINAFEQEDCELEKMKAEFEKRRDTAVKLLSNINHIRFAIPKGAFYLFPNVSYYLGRNLNGQVIDTDQKLADVLLNVGKVAVVPGSAFGSPGHIRISYATTIENIKKGIEGIKKVLYMLN